MLLPQIWTCFVIFYLNSNDVIRMLLMKCCSEWCVVLNHYGLGLYVESWLKSFVISGLPGLWELKYKNLIASVIVFVLTFLWFGRFCYKHYLQTDRNKIPLEPRHLGVPSGASKMIFGTRVHSVQNLHLSCIKITTISKRTETSIHLSLITYEFHRVRPKLFLRLWYVWHKPCTFLALILTLYPNKPKRDFTWASSPRTSFGCGQNDFRALFGTNCAPILH